MPHASNAGDGVRVWYEDDGGHGVPVLLYGGLLDSVPDLRESGLAGALPGDEFRLVYVDHRGLGRSDKPHDPAAYRMAARVGDATAVLDGLGIDRAHVIGRSWGARLGFGIAQQAPERVRSVMLGGQQPYAWPDSPLTRAVADGMADAAGGADAEPVVRALEAFWDVRFPEPTRRRWAANDPAALHAMWTAVLGEGAVGHDLGAWQVPCLIFMGEADADFFDLARRAADEIPTARFLSLVDADHYSAHVSADDLLLAAALHTMRTAG